VLFFCCFLTRRGHGAELSTAQHKLQQTSQQFATLQEEKRHLEQRTTQLEKTVASATSKAAAATPETHIQQQQHQQQHQLQQQQMAEAAMAAQQSTWKLQEANLRQQLAKDRDASSQELGELHKALDQQTKQVQDLMNERDKWKAEVSKARLDNDNLSTALEQAKKQQKTLEQRYIKTLQIDCFYNEHTG